MDVQEEEEEDAAGWLWWWPCIIDMGMGIGIDMGIDWWPKPIMGQVVAVGVGEYVEQKSCECIMDKPIPAGKRGREQQPPRDDDVGVEV